MVSIKLPDGAIRQFDQPVSVKDVAAAIGPGLAKAALAGKVDGKVVDTSYVIDRDASLAIVTDKDAEGLDVIRHSTAHLLAYAVKELFPDAQVTIGPVIEDGFYYDFAYKRPFTPEDLAAIEQRMAELAKKDEPVVRSEMPRDDAVKFFEDMGEHYKAEIIASIPSNEPISLYREGGFIDLCRGPHVPSTGTPQGVQAHEGRGGLLARRFEERDAAADLRHRVDEEGGPGGVHHAHRGSGKARSPQARPSARPLPYAGRGAGHGVLASERLVDLAAGRAVHAPRLPGQRLPGSARAADPRPLAVGALGPLAELQGEHVHDGVGEARLRREADELPGPHPDLQLGPAQLPRPAAALRRVRRRAIATSPRVRCTASCACAASRRTTATSSAPKRRSRTSASRSTSSR